MNSSTKRCLNCGSACQGNYCSTCGQPTSVSEKINRTTFIKSVSKSIARMTPGFWNTLIGLMFKPWVVVHEYIHGQRIKYSEPVTMLIQIMLYFSFIYTVIDCCFGVDFLTFGANDTSISVVSDDGVATDIDLAFFLKYPLLFRLLGSCIAALNCYLVYRNQGSRRHNIYEFFIAAIYMECALRIYSNLCLPISYYWPSVGSTIENILTLSIGTLAIFKAFKIRSWWKAVTRWLLFMLLNFLVLIIVAIILMLTFDAFD